METFFGLEAISWDTYQPWYISLTMCQVVMELQTSRKYSRNLFIRSDVYKMMKNVENGKASEKDRHIRKAEYLLDQNPDRLD